MTKLTTSFLTLAVALLALASCNKMPVSGMRSFFPGEICFFDERFTVDTKAFTEATNAALRTDGFNVAAIIDNGNSIMFNKTMAYNDGVYNVPGEHYYFPKEGTMSFYAVYPTSQNITVTDGAATLSYTQNADIDLVAAKKTAMPASSEPVTLAFDHLLSQVSVKAKGEVAYVDYKVRSVKLIGANGGTYAFEDNKWTSNSSITDVTVYNEESGIAVSSALTEVGSPVSVLPGKVKLNVVWECYNTGTSTVLCSENVTVDFTLRQGKHTTINLTLPLDSAKLLFDTSLGAWVADEKGMNLGFASKLVNGEFTVKAAAESTPAKKVKFTKGNLYWNGYRFGLEEHQYDYPTTRESGHVGHFFWSKDARVAYAAKYSAANTEFGITPAIADTFFAAENGVIDGFTVLSVSEWHYLIDHALAKNSSSKNTITIAGKNCIVLKPDGFNGTVADSYTAEEWTDAESAFGLVALPYTGYIRGSTTMSEGSYGYYWSSTPDSDGALGARGARFYSDEATTSHYFSRDDSRPIRLVQVQ